jgi:predicted porin
MCAIVVLLGDCSPACAGGGCDSETCVASATPVNRQPLVEMGCLGRIAEKLDCGSDCWSMPIGGGGQHWFTEDLQGNNDGYGIRDLRGTYFWYLTADPQYKLRSGNRLGGHVELRLREQDKFRAFFVDQVWTYQAYVSLASDDWGTFKAGQVWKRFGMDWDGVWWGNAAYFDGFKLDPDYGLSWEKTTEINDHLQVDSFLQFFFHEDRVNGSFPGADPESVFGYTERNTGFVRILPRWTLDDGSRLELGLSGLVGEIESSLAGFNDQVASGYAVDMNYYKGPWRLLMEGQQYFGRRNPTNWISGGPSNRISNLLAGIHYTRGSVTYRGNYSASLDSNPAGVQNLVVTGVTVAVSPNIDFYFDYVNQQISGNANPASNGHLFNSLNFIIHWHL